MKMMDTKEEKGKWKRKRHWKEMQKREKEKIYLCRKKEYRKREVE